ncbi:hypothetical protein [Citrobacter cronae]|uniref:hypothetical protein n=1 Tax=Citrobacter cronae TaxID=1748967 RepID=UPI001C11960C|nr:hypothetical protein [Citrobacter cronae]MBU5388681.1 hypothetical protein [Citrobacter cronae]
MKWDEVFIIIFPENAGLDEYGCDPVIVAAEAMIARYNIKHENCFSLNRVMDSPFHDISANCMKVLNSKKTKLIVVSHREKLIKMFTPDKFATLIKFCGGEEISYITFKSCNIGRDDYLDKLKELLPKVGLFSAYKHEVFLHTKINKSKISYCIRADNSIESYLDYINLKLPDLMRKKIVKGVNYRRGLMTQKL